MFPVITKCEKDSVSTQCVCIGHAVPTTRTHTCTSSVPCADLDTAPFQLLGGALRELAEGGWQWEKQCVPSPGKVRQT